MLYCSGTIIINETFTIYRTHFHSTTDEKSEVKGLPVLSHRFRLSGVARLRGSKPASPIMVPSRTFGRGRKGSAKLKPTNKGGRQRKRKKYRQNKKNERKYIQEKKKTKEKNTEKKNRSRKKNTQKVGEKKQEKAKRYVWWADFFIVSCVARILCARLPLFVFIG